MPHSPLETLQTLENGASERTFYVLFYESERLPRWLRPFLDPKYQHCCLAAQVGPVICVVDQCNNAIMQHAFWNWVQDDEGIVPGIFAPIDVENWAETKACEGYEVIRYRGFFDAGNRVWHPCNALPTCVNLCKNLLGVTCWAQTPKQLYHWLLKNGGTLVKEVDHGWRPEST